MTGQYHYYHSNTQSLGFFIHPEKSVLISKQTIIGLEFLISSTNMTFSLTDKKENKD